MGIGTALADDPQLTARGIAGPLRPPARVVFDSFARLPVTSALARGARTIPVYLAVGANAPWDRVTELQDAGVEVVAFPTLRPDVPAVLAALAERGIQSVLVEGGAQLAGAFVAADAVDVVRWFLAPTLIGGDQAPGALGGDGVGHGHVDVGRGDVVISRRHGQVGPPYRAAGQSQPVEGLG